MSIPHFWEQIKAFLKTERGQAWLKYVRYAITLGIGAYLAYQLSVIGWKNVWTSLPTTPWFYVTVVAMYVTLPTFEAFIFRSLWWIRVRDSLPVLFRKRVLNNDVLGYSGEVYFFLWAKKRLGLPDKRLFGTIKDNAIMSSFASWSAVVVLLTGLIYSGLLDLDEIGAVAGDMSMVVAGVAVLVVLVALVILFRKSIFTLDRKALSGLLGAHVSRFLLGYVLQVVQWWVVLPDLSFSVWAKMLALQVLIRRFPFMPAADLVAMMAILQLIGHMDVPQEVIAAMIAVRLALDKAANFGVFVLTSGVDAGIDAAEPPDLGSTKENP